MASQAEIDFFLNSNSNIIQYELFEFKHSAFSQVYRRTYNNVWGVEVILENNESALFDYLPMSVSPDNSLGTLDSSISITVGDLGDIFKKEFDNIFAQDKFGEKIQIVYRTYRSDDLSKPMVGPFYFEADDFTMNSEGSKFTAKAPSVNINGTGEIYTIDRFPMLRGFL